jgi:hypothetical protein
VDIVSAYDLENDPDIGSIGAGANEDLPAEPKSPFDAPYMLVCYKKGKLEIGHRFKARACLWNRNTGWTF